jgi:hypothetical protein
LTLLEIQAGPVESGGAKWNFYRQAQRLDGFQPLLQTILVEETVTTLHVRIKTWVRSPGRFWGLGKTQEWQSDEISYDVSVD